MRVLTNAMVSVVTVLMSASLVQGGNQQEHTEVWERVIAAKGGRERLQAVRTLVIRSHEPEPGGDSRYRRVVGTVQYEFVRAFPDRYWAWEDYRPGAMGFRTEVVSIPARFDWESRRGERATQIAWSARGQSHIADLLIREQLVYLLETSFTKPTIIGSSKQGGRIRLFAAVPGYQQVEYVVDPKTFLPAIVVLTWSSDTDRDKPPAVALPPLTYELADYVSVGGIQMPTTVKGLGRVEYIINPDIDPKLFVTPPDYVVDRNHWKKYLRE